MAVGPAPAARSQLLWRGRALEDASKHPVGRGLVRVSR
jgi:hypothetical protein